MVKRRVIPDLFAALVHSIVGQQISTRAHETIWQKSLTHFGTITPAAIASIPREELQRFGITFRKADYIQSAARKIISGEFDIKELHGMADAEVCNRLSALDGIGIWTAEMMMLHSLQRPDILSFGDLAMQRGFGCCTTTAKSPASCLRNTAAAIHRMAAWRVSTFGRCLPEQWKV